MKLQLRRDATRQFGGRAPPTLDHARPLRQQLCKATLSFLGVRLATRTSVTGRQRRSDLARSNCASKRPARSLPVAAAQPSPTQLQQRRIASLQRTYETWRESIEDPLPPHHPDTLLRLLPTDQIKKTGIRKPDHETREKAALRICLPRRAFPRRHQQTSTER